MSEILTQIVVDAKELTEGLAKEINAESHRREIELIFARECAGALNQYFLGFRIGEIKSEEPNTGPTFNAETKGIAVGATFSHCFREFMRGLSDPPTSHNQAARMEPCSAQSEASQPVKASLSPELESLVRQLSEALSRSAHPQ